MGSRHGPPRGEKRIEIERILTQYDAARRKSGKKIHGMAGRLAKKFGVSRQRISNIAIELGVYLR